MAGCLLVALQWRPSHSLHVVARMHVDVPMSMVRFDLVCWCLQPFGETVEQVFARLSAMRDHFDGPPVRLQCTAACQHDVKTCWVAHC